METGKLGHALTTNEVFELVRADLQLVETEIGLESVASVEAVTTIGQYLYAVRLLDRFAREHYAKRVIHLALRWVLDQPGVTCALWGARYPGQLDPIGDVMGWALDDGALSEIDRIIRDTVKDPVGPEFMAPPARTRPNAQSQSIFGARDDSARA